VKFASLNPGQELVQTTYVTHPWSASTITGNPTADLILNGWDVFVPTSNDDGRTITIKKYVDPATVATVTGG
jgi:hypothetical protein